MGLNSKGNSMRLRNRSQQIYHHQVSLLWVFAKQSKLDLKIERLKHKQVNQTRNKSRRQNDTNLYHKIFLM